MAVSGKVRCLFGTDGVRDVANRGLMTPEMALGLGRSFVLFLTERGIPRPKIAICRDTRRSGTMLENALSAGMMSAGSEIRSLGIFPTPGASYVLRQGGFDAGAVVSASHNPAEYNGIKFLDSRGRKLSDDDEASIEEYLGDGLMDDWRPTGASIGNISVSDSHEEPYAVWLSQQLSDISHCGWTIVVDAANGSAADIVRDVFRPWRKEVFFSGVDYDGLNINDGVGVMHMDNVSGEVIRRSAKLGIALDGDADRVLLCDSKGRVLDGDIMLFVIGRYLASLGLLGSGVVATVMSNMVLEEKLAEHGIKVFRCPVGDRYVLEKMEAVGSRLGGEQSGHITATDYIATGDGLFNGILFIKACIELGEDIDTLFDRFPRYPQKLSNLRLADREKILSSRLLDEARLQAEGKLAGEGRILLRPSGTEPLLRILVEARDEKLMHEVCGDLEKAIMKIGGESF